MRGNQDRYDKSFSLGGMTLLQFFRHLTQLTVFVALNAKFFGIASTAIVVPYLWPTQAQFSTVHGGFESIEYTITSGAIPLTVLGILMFTGSTVGRLFCGWACPIGMLQDFIAYLPFSKSRVDPNYSKYYKDVKYAILGFSLLTAVLVAFRRADDPESIPAGVFSDSFFSVISPSTTLFAYLPFLMVWKSHALVDAGFVAIIKFSFLIIAFLPAFYIPRFFCRYLCPLGALLAPFGSFKFLRISRAKSLSPAALNKTLVDVCPMGAVASEENFINSWDCIHCGKCVSEHPRDLAQTF